MKLPWGQTSDGVDFESFAQSRVESLRRTAYLLCGDVHTADDLTQMTLTKLFLAWSRLERHGELDAYARKVLLRAYLDTKRRPSDSREISVEDVAVVQGVGPRPAGDLADERMVLMAALETLPATPRAVIVLRYWEDLDVNAVADLLRMPPNTVKSHAARGLQVLRQQLSRRGFPAELGVTP